jgi:ubiquitin-protein ligase
LTRHDEFVLKNPALAFSISISAPHPLEYQKLIFTFSVNHPTQFPRHPPPRVRLRKHAFPAGVATRTARPEIFGFQLTSSRHRSP